MARKRIHKGSRRQGRAKVSKRPSALLTGTLSLSRPGVATVSTPEGTYALAKHGIHEAMHGDEVQVSLVSAKGKTPLANVRFVLTRATQTFLGIYHDAGPLGAVVPLDSRIQRDFFVLPEDPSVGRHYVFEGDVVVARITEYPTRKSAAVVTIERRVGSAEDLDMNVEATIASYGLATEFPIKALRQAEKISVDADKALAEGASRHDLREELCITVDPADAKDFDDAVGARKLEDGSFELWVHIADVAHYVNWDSPIDLEARMRTCSAYLVDRVLPMLPEKLCNDVCSLRPAEDRLAMSVKMTLSSSGKILGATAMNSVIRSRARLSYDQVDS
ncbi:MAG: RNB domain-containing ribonuclease, partial [Atopobium sp.]|nr:RNB domain-containing ribonuclease [Atopobium sp.]